MSDNKAMKEREPRSFSRLKAEITNLGVEITELQVHVQALTTITGVQEKEAFPEAPTPTENPSHMERLLVDITDFRIWVKTLDAMFRKQLRELVPEYYANMAKDRPG